MRSEEHTELVAAVRAWDEAMVSNDAEAIGRFMTDDWVIVGPDGSIDDRQRFLSLIAAGDLLHDTMTSDDLVIRILGDTAIVIARGVSAGEYQGARFRAHERSSNVFTCRDGRWVCALTHLSRFPAD